MKSDRLYQFAGASAVSADLDALEMAKKMIANGRHPEITRKATGWFSDVDGSWKWEISDHEAELALHPSELDTSNLNDLEIGSDVHQRAFVYLPQFLRHPTIYEYYPKLKNIRVSELNEDEKAQGIRGSFCADRQLLELNFDRDPSDVLSTTLHEIQHAIQFIEGFGYGGMEEALLSIQIKDALVTDSMRTKLALNEWRVKNSDKLLELNRLEEEHKFALLYRSINKLIDYSQSERPNSLKRHIDNEAGWLMSELFQLDDKIAHKRSSEAELLRKAIYDLPKTNSKKQRDRFLSNYAFDVAMLYKDRMPQRLYRKFKADDRTPLSIVKGYERDLDRLNKEIRPMRVLESAHSKASKLQEDSKWLSNYEVYRHLSGEVEARATQARMNMTDEERLNTPKVQSIDVPENSQFVVLPSGKYIGEAELTRMLSKSHETGRPEPKGEMVLGGSYFAEIILNKNADASTIVHEAAHVFLEVHSELSKELHPSSDLRKDFVNILNWQGLSEKEWHSMTLDQRRGVHEEFAVSFEKYLAGGRTEDPSLLTMFLKLKEWITEIYSCDNKFPETKALTGDVEVIFDRLISKTKQEPDPFTESIRERLETHSNISNAVAEVTSKMIDSSYSVIAARAGIERSAFNKKFSVCISTPTRKESLKLSTP